MRYPLSQTSQNNADIRRVHPRGHIQAVLASMNIPTITPMTSPPTIHRPRIVATLPYLTQEEHSELVTNLQSDTEQNKEEGRALQERAQILHRVFSNAQLECTYISHQAKTYTLEEDTDSIVKVKVHPNCLSYVEYPKQTSPSASLQSGAYKHFYVQEHKGVFIPSLISSCTTYKHTPTTKEKAQEIGTLLSLKAKSLPLLTQRILDGLTQGIRGLELVVLPEVVESPSEANDNTMIYIQSHYGKETLQQRSQREYKHNIGSRTKAKERLRDIMMANHALTRIGLFNLDIKPENSIVWDDDKGNERILQIDIDDLAIKHCITQEERDIYCHGKTREVLSNRSEYALISHITKDIQDNVMRDELTARLYQNRTFLDIYLYLLPRKIKERSLLYTFASGNTFYQDPKLCFITTHFPIAFLTQLARVYKRESALKAQRHDALRRLTMMIEQYKTMVLQSDQRRVTSMKARLLLSSSFTPLDYTIMLSQKYHSYFINTLPLSTGDDEIPLIDVDSLETITADAKLTDCALTEEIRELFLDNIDFFIKELKTMFGIKSEVADADLTLLLQLILNHKDTIAIYDMEKKTLSQHLTELTTRVRDILFQICKAHEYTKAHAPQLYGLIPVLSEKQIEDAKQHLDAQANVETIDTGLDTLTLQEDPYADMPPLED